MTLNLIKLTRKSADTTTYQIKFKIGSLLVTGC